MMSKKKGQSSREEKHSTSGNGENKTATEHYSEKKGEQAMKKGYKGGQKQRERNPFIKRKRRV